MSTSREEAQKKENAAMNLILMRKRIEDKCALIQRELDNRNVVNDDVKRFGELNAQLVELKKIDNKLDQLGKVVKSSTYDDIEKKFDKLVAEFKIDMESFDGIFAPPANQEEKNYAMKKIKGWAPGAAARSATASAVDLDDLENSITQMRKRINNECKRLEDKGDLSDKERVYLTELNSMRKPLMNLARNEVFASSSPLPGQDSVNELKAQFDGLQKRLYKAELAGKGFARASNLTTKHGKVSVEKIATGRQKIQAEFNDTKRNVQRFKQASEMTNRGYKRASAMAGSEDKPVPERKGSRRG